MDSKEPGSRPRPSGSPASTSPTGGDDLLTGERQRLHGEVLAARRRVITARADLAGTRNAELRSVQAAQRALSRERVATERAVAAIASETASDLARALGRAEPTGRAQSAAAASQPPDGAVDPFVADLDLPALQAELDRLYTQAAILERQVQSAYEAAPAVAPPGLSVLHRVLDDALDVAREQHQQRLGNAVEDAREQHRVARERMATDVHRRRAVPPVETGHPRSSGHPAEARPAERQSRSTMAGDRPAVVDLFRPDRARARREVAEEPAVVELFMPDRARAPREVVDETLVGLTGAGRVRSPREVVDQPSRPDRIFDRLTLGSGLLVLVLLTLVGVFLLWQSRHALAESGWSFFTRVGWDTLSRPARIGVLGLVIGTVIVALIAVIVAIPLGICAALYITEYAAPKVRQLLQTFVDLLAAVPSIIFGLWGFLYFMPKVTPLSRWLTRHLSFIPFFRTTKDTTLAGSMFIAGLVVSLMVLPIVASIVREVFAQAPVGEKEAALALGGTRWGMIRMVLLPYGRGGIIGGSMLGLGRALGETIAVALLLPEVPTVSSRILQNGGATIAGFIANRAGGDAFTTSGLMAAGLVLFVMTLGTNMVASLVVSRSRSGAGVD